MTVNIEQNVMLGRAIDVACGPARTEVAQAQIKFHLANSVVEWFERLCPSRASIFSRRLIV
tara:strand:+ start:326 stop:508 length:183 start_codon:yes stop_codon:yes gene_type:complete